MEKAQVVKRQQRFQEQFAVLDAELRALCAQQQAGTNLDTSTKRRAVARRELELQYELGVLCAKQGECQLAVLYFQRLVDELKPPSTTSVGAKDEGGAADEEPRDQQRQAELAALRINVLNCLAVLQFRQGDQAKALALLLEAKQLHREAATTPTDGDTNQATEIMGDADLNLMGKTLAVNYALFLHAKGNLQDAILVARSVVEAPTNAGHSHSSDAKAQTDGFQHGLQRAVATNATDAAARSTAYMLLAGCNRDQDEQASEALAFAELAVEAADQTANAELQCRAHSNLGLFRFERGESTVALPHFIAAFRAALRSGDLHLQAITKYHLGVVIAHADSRDVDAFSKDGMAIPDDELGISVASDKSTSAPVEFNTDEVVASDPPTVVDNDKQQAPNSTSVSGSVMTPARTPKDWFLQSESLAGALSEPDSRLGVLAHGCRGEEEYYAGEFHTAEAEFTIALKRLKGLLGQPTSSTSNRNGSNDEYDPTEPIDIIAVREMDPELAKLQGFLLSYLGCAQLVEGRIELAERSHQSDLALALEREDVYAQQRALRNLAMVFNCTQHYEKAIPMWRDALEIAAVLQSKSDQMMALSGLGTALKEFQLLQRTSSSSSPPEADNDEDTSLRAPPLPIFFRQRALAIEVGDRHQQILAQRHIVSVYESHTNDFGGHKPDSSAGESAIEKWLAECDVLVRLCEQYENLQYRADAYRSLANALTAQLARLRSRGAARFADAINVLSQKRDAVCNKYQDATAALALATAVVFYHSEADEMPLELKERQSRASVARVDVFPRR